MRQFVRIDGIDGEQHSHKCNPQRQRQRKRWAGPVEIQKPELKRLFDYWIEKAGDRSIPSCRDLDAVFDIPQLVKNIWLVDVERDPPRFRYRLLGTQVVERYGLDFTGRCLDEIDYGGHNETVRLDYEKAVRLKQPVYRCRMIETVDTLRRQPYERILFPLSDDGETVSMVLGGGFSVGTENCLAVCRHSIPTSCLH